MSVRRNTIKYGAAAAVLALAIIAGSSFLAGSSILSGFQSSGPNSLLVIQLTDPPQVPVGTSSLNLTYTSLNLLVGEPTGVDGQMNPKTISVTPSGGSATLDLLKLQNISQTIGSVVVPDGSVIYSATFAVSGIKIDVSGTKSPVSLESGSTLTVTMANDHPLHGTNTALLQLNPVVVNTPSGYQLIPSSVGVLRLSEGQGEEQVGSHHQLNSGDQHDLDQALGTISANLLELSVSGTTTTMIAQVNNTGSEPVQLNAIGINGNFSVQGNACSKGESNQNGHDSQCKEHDHSNEVVFVPVIPAPPSTTTTSSTATASKTCVSGQMTLVNGDSADNNEGGLVLTPGECINLTFKGTVSFGESSMVLTPNTGSGQTYSVHIIATQGATSNSTASYHWAPVVAS